MKKLLLVLAMVACGDSFAIDAEFYISTALGYKFDEANALDPSPVSFKAEVGFNNVLIDDLRIGVGHDSQPWTGWPLNNKKEPYKTEVFVGYTWRWGL